MAQQLKRWESPRNQGRNHKGRGGSAKQRQYIKRQKQLRKRLQAGIDGSLKKDRFGNGSSARKDIDSNINPNPVPNAASNDLKLNGLNLNEKREAHELLFFFDPFSRPFSRRMV